jgi:hypothetical protein
MFRYRPTRTPSANQKIKTRMKQCGTKVEQNHVSLNKHSWQTISYWLKVNIVNQTHFTRISTNYNPTTKVTTDSIEIAENL